MSITYTTTTTKPRLEISYDHFCDSSREDSNLWSLYMNCPRYLEINEVENLNIDFQDITIKVIKQLLQGLHIAKLTPRVYSSSCYNLNGHEVIKIDDVIKWVSNQRKLASNNPKEAILEELTLFDALEGLGADDFALSYKTEKVKDIYSQLDSELELLTKECNGEVYMANLYDENGEIQEYFGSMYSLDELKEYLPKEFYDLDLTEFFVNY